MAALREIQLIFKVIISIILIFNLLKILILIFVNTSEFKKIRQKNMQK